MIASGVCLVIVFAWLIASASSAGKVMHGVRVAERDVSGFTHDQALAAVLEVGGRRAQQPLALSLGKSSVSCEPQRIGFQLDAEASVQRALSIGRSGGALTRFAGFVARWFHAEQVPLDGRFDAARLAAAFDDWQATAIDTPPFAGGIAWQGSEVTPLYPRAGTVIDRPLSTLRLKRAILSGATTEALATRSETPETTRADVDGIVNSARALAGAGVELATADGTRRLPVSAKQIAATLEVAFDSTSRKLRLSCAAASLTKWLDARRSELEQPAKDARFVIDAQDQVHVEPSQSGLVLSDESVARALCAAASTPERKGLLPLAPGAEPALSTADAEHLGIKGLVSTFTTRHACCQPRVQNIHHIADLLDATLVRPGETFSVNARVGQRTVKNGFRSAPSIEDGDMVETVGGGVSQFATTLFNALFYGGYDIIERQPHTYWFTRYPMGLDATLSIPHPDIVFKNDTEAGALIKTAYTDTTITVKMYGDNGGRRVRSDVSARQNIVQPPLEYIPNPHLDADEEKTREGGEIGWTVLTRRFITYPDGKVKEEKRKVTYKPRARRVEVHPCRIPAGEPGHTGERCPKPDPDKEKDDTSAPAQ